MTEKRVEVSVPVSLVLAGRGCFTHPEMGERAGFVSVCVALDRRVSCIVAPAGRGILVESRDSGEKVYLLAMEASSARGDALLVLEVLRGLEGLEGGEGVHLILHRRVPTASGLAIMPSLTLAVTVGVATFLARSLSPAEESRLAFGAAQRTGYGRYGPSSFLSPRCGGVVAIGGAGDASRELAADPALVEECLLLVDTGAPDETALHLPECTCSGEDPSLPGRLAAALEGGRMADVTLLLQADWKARRGSSGSRLDPVTDRIASLTQEAGGAVWLLGTGRGGLVPVWAPPGERGRGPRERLESALREEGLRLVRPRIDLLGLQTG